MSSSHRHLAFAAAALLLSGTAAAQLLPSLPIGGAASPLGRVPVVGPTIDNVLGAAQRQAVVAPTLDSLGVPDAVASLEPMSLLDLRRARLQQLVASVPGQLEMDERGNPVRRGILVALDPDQASLAAASRAGFRVVGQEQSDEFGIRVVLMQAPAKLRIRDALKRLRKAAPGMEVDYDPIYEPAGGALLASGAALAAQGGGGAARSTIVMIDGGVAAHPSLANASIEQRPFAGSAKATGHGTAIASLLVGEQGKFRGAARGTRLFVADVYGGSRSAGSATAIFRALAWGASQRPDVISISLVGPGNRLLERAVGQLSARGIRMVAAVGNDGPAAPVQYPAAYPGVVAVTAVDGRDRALPEAGRAARLDFAAPGADMAAALPGSGYARVRGTSFATPLVAARLAAAGNSAALLREAVPGRGKVGRGIVCRSCRIDPRAVAAK